MLPKKERLNSLTAMTTTNSSSVLGNLASVDVVIKISPLTVLYLVLLIAVGACSAYLVSKYG